MQTVIYLVRHGVVDNPKNILTGRLPGFKLSDEGVNQIEKTAGFLKNKGVTHIYTSPLLRTQQTARIIKRILNLSSISFSRHLIEIESSLDGSLRSNLEKTNFDYFSDQYRRAGDETIDQISSRMLTFINKIKKRHRGKKIVAVSHGDPIMIIRAVILKLPLVLNSIRDPDNPYMKCGEAFKVTIDATDKITINGAFTPY